MTWGVEVLGWGGVVPAPHVGKNTSERLPKCCHQDVRISRDGWPTHERHFAALCNELFTSAAVPCGWKLHLFRKEFYSTLACIIKHVRHRN